MLALKYKNIDFTDIFKIVRVKIVAEGSWRGCGFVREEDGGKAREKYQEAEDFLCASWDLAEKRKVFVEEEGDIVCDYGEAIKKQEGAQNVERVEYVREEALKKLEGTLEGGRGQALDREEGVLSRDRVEAWKKLEGCVIAGRGEILNSVSCINTIEKFIFVKTKWFARSCVSMVDHRMKEISKSITSRFNECDKCAIIAGIKEDYNNTTRGNSPRRHKFRRKALSQKSSKSNCEIFKETAQHERSLPHLNNNLFNETKRNFSNNTSNEFQISLDSNSYSNNNIFLKINRHLKPLSPIKSKNLNSGKYCKEMWSGDYKTNNDSRDSFLEDFKDILGSSTSNMDMAACKDCFFSHKIQSSIESPRFRLKKDTDFDEGFSENESFDDTDSNSLFNKVSERKVKETLQYCGDCDYNSSNSKVPDNLDKDVIDSSSHSDILYSINQDLEASDSDGGTDILNSVNDTVNKFNAIMESNGTMSGMHAHHTNDILYEKDVDCTKILWTSSPSKHLCDSIVPVLVDSPVFSLVKTTSPYKQEKVESPSLNVSSRHSPMLYNHNQLSVSTISNFNQETSSKVLPSINVHNWCPYNYNYLPAQPFNFPFKQSKNYEIPISSNYDLQKVSSWLPYISPGSNTYNVTSNNHQQQLHRILLPPHLSLPSMNLGTMQHNIFPHIFQQPQTSIHDSDYLDRRFPSNNPKLLSTSKNVSDSRILSSAINVVPNSNNHSNAPFSKHLVCQNVFKGSLDKSQRACCFYMRGGCKKEDCEYAHDLSKVTCKFWEKGDCFKADTCPFKHGYQKD